MCDKFCMQISIGLMDVERILFFFSICCLRLITSAGLVRCMYCNFAANDSRTNRTFSFSLRNWAECMRTSYLMSIFNWMWADDSEYLNNNNNREFIHRYSNGLSMFAMQIANTLRRQGWNAAHKSMQRRKYAIFNWNLYVELVWITSII